MAVKLLLWLIAKTQVVFSSRGAERVGGSFALNADFFI